MKGTAAGDQSRTQGGAPAAQGDCDPVKLTAAHTLPSSMCAPILDQQGLFLCPLSLQFKGRPCPRHPRPSGPRHSRCSPKTKPLPGPTCAETSAWPSGSFWAHRPPKGSGPWTPLSLAARGSAGEEGAGRKEGGEGEEGPGHLGIRCRLGTQWDQHALCPHPRRRLQGTWGLSSRPWGARSPEKGDGAPATRTVKAELPTLNERWPRKSLCPWSPALAPSSSRLTRGPHGPSSEAIRLPLSSSEAASHANVFRIHDISETSICIYLDSISKELFKIGAIWMDGCGMDCFLSVSIKNTVFSKWITDAVIMETSAGGNFRTVTFDSGTLRLRTGAQGHPS